MTFQDFQSLSIPMGILSELLTQFSYSPPVTTFIPTAGLILATSDSLSHPSVQYFYNHPCSNALTPWADQATSMAPCPHTRLPVWPLLSFHLLDHVLSVELMFRKLVHLPLRQEVNGLIESITCDTEHFPDWSKHANLSKDN